jgi:glycosyltransferase involved in cell wall biosynthesis
MGRTGSSPGVGAPPRDAGQGSARDARAGTSRVKLAILNLTAGGLSGGYLKYLERVVPLLSAHPTVRRLDVLMPPNGPSPRLAGVPTFTWPPWDRRTGYRTLRRHLRQLAPDVVFVPTARWLDCGPIPVVIMVRNMEPLTVPFGGNSWLEGVRNLARAWAARRACRRATRVVAVSGHVREFLTVRWHITPEKVGVVYHGVDPAAAEPPTAQPPALGRPSPEPFIFTAGSIRPARGLEDAIRAMEFLAADHPALRLVIAGRATPATEAYERRMRRLSGAQAAGRIVWTGQLTPDEMAWCFRRAAAYLTTSRAEACPNTALEAMSYGCLVVSTRQAPMPEVFADAALYYHPGNGGDLADQLRKVLTSGPEERAGRRQALQARARQFQWRETVDRTIEELARAVGVGSGLIPERRDGVRRTGWPIP